MTSDRLLWSNQKIVFIIGVVTPINERAYLQYENNFKRQVTARSRPQKNFRASEKLIFFLILLNPKCVDIALYD